MTKELYACSECDYVYRDRATAERCEAYCKTHRACSMEITKLAVGKITK